MAFANALAVEAGRVDDSYFESYSYLDIHREMLSDKVKLILLKLDVDGLGVVAVNQICCNSCSISCTCFGKAFEILEYLRRGTRMACWLASSHVSVPICTAHTHTIRGSARPWTRTVRGV